jgi:hypothetical protein
MAQAPSASRIVQAVTHQVFYRTWRSPSQPLGPWVWDPRLRCDQVKLAAGPHPGFARLSVIRPGRLMPVEQLLDMYALDDHVRVVMQPPANPAVAADVPAQTRGFTLFEGFISRQPFRMVGASGSRSEDEGIELVAQAMPVLDNRQSEHLIRGRWVATPQPGDQQGYDTMLLETPAVPVAFNFQGRPNMFPTTIYPGFSPAGGSAVWSVSGSGDAAPAPVFAVDGFAESRWWTVRQAIHAVLAYWVYGPAYQPLSRHLCIEAATRRAILTGPATDDPAHAARFHGFDARLAETDVTGMGPLDAIAAICSAAGFEMAVLPAFTPPAEAQTYDQLYQLTIWRRNTGPMTDLKLLKRDAFAVDVDDVEKDLKRNNFTRLWGMRDTAHTVNQVHAVGRTYIECTIDLKPLWNPADRWPQTPQANFQLDARQVPDSDYHRRHVAGGDLFAQYGHVGRIWGVDGDGLFAQYGYGTGIYRHDPKGFDWTTAVGLSDENMIDQERIALGIADPPVMARRQRRALPIRRPEAAARGIEYVLEVSEDAGSQWHIAPVRFQTLTEYFGVRLTDPVLANLAAVNMATLGTSERPDLDASWWGLIRDLQLLFRLTAWIDADFAARYDARRRGSSASRYRFARWASLHIEEAWAAPHSFFNQTQAHVKIPTWAAVAPASGEPGLSVREWAERLRDAEEGLRLSATVWTWLMRPDLWPLGARVWGVRGRDLSFAGGGGESARHPAIVAVTITLAPEQAQGISLELHDEAMKEGV